VYLIIPLQLGKNALLPEEKLGLIANLVLSLAHSDLKGIEVSLGLLVGGVCLTVKRAVLKLVLKE
jgi:hypothetical protein